MIQKSHPHIPSFKEAELIKKNQQLEAKLSYRRYFIRTYEGDRPNINWIKFLKRIPNPIFPKLRV